MNNLAEWNMYAPQKRGPKPMDMKGYQKLVFRVRSSIAREPTAHVIYVKDKGFKVVTKIREHMGNQIEAGLAVIVGVYKTGVLSQHLVDDFEFIERQIELGAEL